MRNNSAIVVTHPCCTLFAAMDDCSMAVVYPNQRFGQLLNNSEFRMIRCGGEIKFLNSKEHLL